jgi:G3E family GTPase
LKYQDEHCMVITMATEKIPTTVFTGFLGSGKTTIISHLIDTLQKQGRQVAYIKNEIGDTDIDSQLLQGKNIKTTELVNGCICCTLVGPFATAVTELVSAYHPDRILIEASGAADPAAIALMISSHPLLYRDGVISIVDVENFDGYKDLSITAQRQTQFTDLIVFNKVETTSLDRKRAVVGYVRELNTHSPIIEAPHGTVSTELVFGLDPHYLNSIESDQKLHEHIEHDHFSSFTVHTKGNIEPESLKKVLVERPKTVFRAKGIFLGTDQEWYSFNGVGKKVDIIPLSPRQFTSNVFVFIGQHYSPEQETELTNTLQDLLETH